MVRGISWSNGYVYFVRAENGLIKIGFSLRHPSKRLKDLQGASPEKLELIGFFEGSVKDESATHRKFEKCRSHCEWFKPSKELSQFIKEKING